MLTGRQVIRFRKKLLAWFADCRRDLPWRRTKDPYRIWLSEIMLQQTRVAAVIPYYERFLERFPDVRALADAPGEEVLRLWAGLGYYSRARNLQKAARKIVAEFDSRFPDSQSTALELSGIGHYTAAAILSIAYGKRLAVLDGNVARVLSRIGGVRGDLRTDGRWQKLQSLADGFLAPQAPGKWNEAMMELGATICAPRSPQCLVCPVAEFCEARRLGLTEAIPQKRKKRGGVDVTLAALVMVDAGELTLLLPPPSPSNTAAHGHDVAALLSRLWHFPTIEVQRDAKSELQNFSRQSLLLEDSLVSGLLPLTKVCHTVTYRTITIESFRLDLGQLPRIAGAKKLPLHDVGSVAISGLTRKVARAALTGRCRCRPKKSEGTPVLAL